MNIYIKLKLPTQISVHGNIRILIVGIQVGYGEMKALFQQKKF